MALDYPCNVTGSRGSKGPPPSPSAIRIRCEQLVGGKTVLRFIRHGNASLFPGLYAVERANLAGQRPVPRAGSMGFVKCLIFGGSLFVNFCCACKRKWMYVVGPHLGTSVHGASNPRTTDGSWSYNVLIWP